MMILTPEHDFQYVDSYLHFINNINKVLCTDYLQHVMILAHFKIEPIEVLLYHNNIITTMRVTIPATPRADAPPPNKSSIFFLNFFLQRLAFFR